MRFELLSGRNYKAGNILIATAADCIPAPFQRIPVRKKIGDLPIFFN
jgi:hypothetical protein